MSLLMLFEKIGFAVNWEIIRYGLIDNEMLSVKEINDYADKILLDSLDIDNKNITLLSFLKEKNEIIVVLKKIAPTISDQTKKKWHIVLLQKNIDETLKMKGSFRDKAEHLYTYWHYSEFFNESPFVCDKTFMSSPLDISTQMLLEKLISSHQLYLEKEIKLLR